MLPPISEHLHAGARGCSFFARDARADARMLADARFFARDARADARMLADAPDPADAPRMRKHPAADPNLSG